MLLSRGQCVALIYALTALIYVSPMLSTSGDWGFLPIWDDRENFLENELLQSSVSLQTLYDMFTMVKISVYEPLGWMLKFAVVQAVGLDAWWVRMVSMVIHFGAGVILAKTSALVLDVDYMLAEMRHPSSTGLELRTRKKRSQLHFHACCLSAAVFVVHPLHVEVVVWPSAQPYALAALFSYWALLVHVESIHQNLSQLLGGNIEENVIKGTNILPKVLIGGGTSASSFLSSVLYLCALLSKSASLLLPAGFFLLDAWVCLQLNPQQRAITPKQIIKYAARKLPSTAILLAFVLVTVFSNTDGDVPDIIELSLGERALKALTSPVWVARCLMWPSKLRPHYQIQPGDVSLSNPECLLSTAAVVLVLALILLKTWHREISKHTLALAFFVAMLLPVSGLIQHGMVAAGANRYAYMPTIIVVPYGGWAVAHWLLGGSSLQDKPQHLMAPAWGLQERQISLKGGRRTKEEKRISSTLPLHSNKIYAWAVGFLLIASLLLVSTDLLTHWRNEDSLYEYSLRMDPTDWKLYGQRAETLLHAGRCSPDDTECRQLWILAYDFSPRCNLKGKLYRLHLLVCLREIDHACDGYISLLKDHTGNASVHNNAAVCLVIRGRLAEARREFSLALQCPDIERTTATHTTNARDFDKWETERARHNADDIPGFVGTMTY